jgi:CBS domain-containing protein
VTGEIRLARHTPVSVCQGLLEIEPLLVRRDDELLVVLRQAAAQPATRLIGIIDDAGVLVGVLPIVRIAESVIGRVVPEALLADIEDVDDVASFDDAIEARTAGDVMIGRAAISPEATIDDAFRIMHARHLSGLYVVDPNGRPTGYLDMLELAIRYAQAIEADSSPQSG